MKPDERDIICEQDYSPLSNAELVAHIELYARLIHNTPLSDGEWLDDILGPARVLLARAEAAEALSYERLEGALFAEQRASDAEIERDSANVEAALEQSNAREAWQRVSELEAQLAAAHLNPYNTAPLAEHVIVTLRTEGWRDEDGLWDWDDYGDWDVVGWQPLPPAPAPQEPTP